MSGSQRMKLPWPRVLPEFTKFPNGWIEDRRLTEFTWTGSEGPSNAAALRVLLVIANHMEAETGVSVVTYDDLSAKANLSRAKVADGLSILIDQGLVSRSGAQRSQYVIADYNPASGWAKLPAKKLYSGGRILAFDGFTLRRRAELDAMKLYFLFASRRDRNSNSANLSYDMITEYSGIHRNHIRAGTSLLAANGMVHVQYHPTVTNQFGGYCSYRLVHLNPYHHEGTRGRASL